MQGHRKIRLLPSPPPSFSSFMPALQTIGPLQALPWCWIRYLDTLSPQHHCGRLTNTAYLHHRSRCYGSRMANDPNPGRDTTTERRGTKGVGSLAGTDAFSNK